MICLKCKRETNNKKFCSKSCANSFNNVGKRKHGSAPKTCLLCPKQIARDSKYCQSCRSIVLWQDKVDQISNGIILADEFMKRYLVEKEQCCSECKLGLTWNSKPLTLQLDHIDGNTDNRDLSNLRLLCPNCHSQTSTFGSKNKGSNSKKNLYRRQWYNTTVSS